MRNNLGAAFIKYAKRCQKFVWIKATTFSKLSGVFQAPFVDVEFDGMNQYKNEQHKPLPKASVRSRPALFQALGKADPPEQVEIDGKVLARRHIFKHDSWAATALYDSPHSAVVCKFNRTQSCFGIPMQWLGRWLASREAYFFRLLQDIPGVPRGWAQVVVDGKIAPTAFAHDFVPGQPLSLVHDSSAEFFDELSALLDAIHVRNMAYVDLNKPENVLVGDDGHPYLFDFQISMRLPNWPLARALLRLLQRSDHYHLLKHRLWRLNRDEFEVRLNAARPFWIRWHRKIGVPLRTLRRQILVWFRIRQGDGAAQTELAPEHGLCTAEKVAARKKAA